MPLITKQAEEAAALLKQIASQHKKGTPIPAQIEEASDRWMWLKLHARRGLEVRVKTPGRVTIIILDLCFSDVF